MIELTCNLKGQYLSIELPGTEYLQLCEVQAFEGQCEGRFMSIRLHNMNTTYLAIIHGDYGELFFL